MGPLQGATGGSPPAPKNHEGAPSGNLQLQGTSREARPSRHDPKTGAGRAVWQNAEQSADLQLRPPFVCLREGARQTAGFARSGPAQRFPPCATRLLVWCQTSDGRAPIGTEPVVEGMDNHDADAGHGEELALESLPDRGEAACLQKTEKGSALGQPSPAKGREDQWHGSGVCSYHVGGLIAKKMRAMTMETTNKSAMTMMTMRQSARARG